MVNDERTKIRISDFYPLKDSTNKNFFVDFCTELWVILEKKKILKTKNILNVSSIMKATKKNRVMCHFISIRVNFFFFFCLL